MLCRITADEMTGDLYQFGPLTTSVNAVSWQDYVGMVVFTCTQQEV